MATVDEDDATAPQPRPTRLKRLGRGVWRWSKRLLLALLGLALILALFALEENARGWWMLRQERATILAAGETFNPAEIAPKVSAAEARTAAAVFASDGFFLRLEDKRPLIAVMRITEVQSHGEVVSLGKEMAPKVILSEWVKSVPLTWDEFSAELAAGTMELDAAKESLKKPAAVVLDYSTTNAMLVHTLNLSKWLKADFIWRIHTGDIEAAKHDLRTRIAIQRLERTAADPFFQLVSAFSLMSATEMAWAILQMPQITEPQLADLQRDLEPSNTIPPVVRSYEMALARTDQWFAFLRGSSANRNSIFYLRSPLRFDLIRNQFRDYLPDQIEAVLTAFLWRIAWSHQDESRALRETYQILVGIRAFERDKNWDLLKKSISSATDSDWWNSTRFAISNDRIEEGQNILRRVALAITRQQLAIAAVALKRYQLRHGALPESLGELVPEFLAAVPHDWMNGQPLRYQRKEGGKFLLYSVGLDGVDDGGNPLPADAKKKPQFLDGRDLVWPQVAGS